MSFRLLKIGLLTFFVSLTVSVGIGIFLGRKHKVEQLPRSGEEAYAEGLRDLQGGNAGAAAVHFQEAVLLADKALDEVIKQRSQQANLSAEVRDKIGKVEAEAYWLKARALRDQAYADGSAKGKALPEAVDEYTHVKYRDLLRIPTEADRGEAVQCLAKAAWMLPDLEELQQETLRLGLTLEPMHWPLVERAARNVVRLSPKDQRGLYVLAWHDFEQPPLAPDKRSFPQVRKAREYLTRLQELENPPRWRTLSLQAQMHLWMKDYNLRNDKPEDARAEEVALHHLLFDLPTGVLALAARDDHLAQLDRTDARALLGLHRGAVETIVESLRRPFANTPSGLPDSTAEPPTADAEASALAPPLATVNKDKKTLTVPRLTAEDLVRALKATLAVCDKLGRADASRLAEVLETAVASAARAQPFLVKKFTPDWHPAEAAILEIAHQAADKNLGSALAYVTLVEILRKDARLEGKREKPNRQEELKKEALEWLDVGLKVARAQKLSPAQMANLHALAADMKATDNANPADVEVHLQALKASGQAESQARAHILEGALARREGRLELARKHFEQALLVSQSASVLRAHFLLAEVNLALRQPDKALASLREVTRAYDRFDQLPEDEKDWAYEFLASRDQITIMQIQAHLDTAYQKAAQAARETGTAAPVAKVVKTHEETAQDLIAKLTPGSALELGAHKLLATHYALTGRPDKAETELTFLRRATPDSIEVLRLEIVLKVQEAQWAAGARTEIKKDPQVVAGADQRIQAFITAHPNDLAGRLLWVEWLTATSRADQAFAYLEDPANFPGLKDQNRYQRLHAVALLRMGQGARGVETLAGAALDGAAPLLQMAGTPEELREQMADVLTRQESNGLLRCRDAGAAYQQRDFAKAAEVYLQAMEFTRVKDLAREGLLRSLFALGRENPAKVRDFTTRKLKDNPDESGLLLPLAFACLMLDDLGNPRQPGSAAKDMVSALSTWEATLAKQQGNGILAPVTMAEFWKAANRPDLAREELSRALKRNPSHEPSLWLTLQTDLDLGTPAALAEARQLVAALKTARPESPEVSLVLAELDRRDGKMAQAVQGCEALLDKHPNFSAGYAALVALLEELGDKEKTKSWLERWLSKEPGNGQAVKSQVRNLAALGQVAQAKKVAEAYLSEQIKKTEEQIATWKPVPGLTAADLDKHKQAVLDNVRAVTELNLASGLILGQAWEEAEAWVRRILERHPDMELAQTVLGDLFMARVMESKGEARAPWVAKAKEVYQPLLKDHPGNAVAANNLAWLLSHECGDPTTAFLIAQDLRKGPFSKKPLPGDRLRPEILDTLGAIYHQLNRPELYPEMRELFEAAHTRYPTDPRMCLYLAYAYRGLGDPRKAEDLLAAAMTLCDSQALNGLTAAERKTVKDEAVSEREKLKTRAEDSPGASRGE